VLPSGVKVTHSLRRVGAAGGRSGVGVGFGVGLGVGLVVAVGAFVGVAAGAFVAVGVGVGVGLGDTPAATLAGVGDAPLPPDDGVPLADDEPQPAATTSAATMKPNCLRVHMSILPERYEWRRSRTASTRRASMPRRPASRPSDGVGPSLRDRDYRAPRPAAGGSAGRLLAPAFHLDPMPGQLEHELAIDGQVHTADIGLVIEKAPFYRLSGRQARVIVDEVRDGLASWKTAAATGDLGAAEIEILGDTIAI
jgi:hypothetical protein